MGFTGEKLEKAFTELLEKEGFPYYLVVSITHKPEEVLIESCSFNNPIATIKKIYL